MFDAIQNTVKAFSSRRLQPWENLERTLLFGEGNLSFAKSLLFLPSGVKSMTATTFEKQTTLSDETKENSVALRCHGVLVLHNVDATSLERSLKKNEYDSIIFQFPNVGSREPKYGHNPNHILIRKFLKNVIDYLTQDGRVFITSVNSPYYDGIFQFGDAAKFAGYKIIDTYPFDPSMFRGYSHVNTLDDESAIKDHKCFVTRVFEKEK